MVAFVSCLKHKIDYIDVAVARKSTNIFKATSAPIYPDIFQCHRQLNAFSDHQAFYSCDRNPFYHLLGRKLVKTKMLGLVQLK